MGGHTEGAGGRGCRHLAGEEGRKGSQTPLGTVAAARGVVQGKMGPQGHSPAGPRGSGQGCALFPESREVGGPSGHAWPGLCPAPTPMSCCPLALTGLLSQAACRRQAAPHTERGCRRAWTLGRSAAGRPSAPPPQDMDVFLKPLTL